MNLPIDTIICGDALIELQTLPSESVDCCVTSPPYYGLRDYGVDGQIGLEESPEAYVSKLVEIFREVKRVLKDEGTLWLNLGDSYSRDVAKGGSGPNGKHDFIPDYGNARKIMSESKGSSDGGVGRADRAPVRVCGSNLKPKDLIGVPWMVAFALRADGWYLRSDIIWHKPNCMPESVTDRPTKSHEYIFLLSKSARYYYDDVAISERSAYPHDNRSDRKDTRKEVDPFCADNGSRAKTGNPTGLMRNKRTVWTIPTRPYSEAHFATFPEALVEPCVKAGCPENGTVLDPFFGAGTTGLVARKHNRHYVGIDLSSAYCDIARKRIAAIPCRLDSFA
jgi:DNA modification methylase